jgi:putative lipoic acid-binding regulatory protein
MNEVNLNKKENTVLDAGKPGLDLEYPCMWIYKIIGTDQREMESVVTEIIRDRSYKISFSRISEKARYISLNLEMEVESESHRIDLYKTLKASQAIKLVL